MFLVTWQQTVASTRMEGGEEWKEGRNGRPIPTAGKTIRH